MSKKHLIEFILVTLIGTLLAVIITWPFAAHISTYYTDQGDYPLGGAVLWYNQDAIKSGKIFDQQEYFQGYQFYPQPMPLAFSNNMVVPSLIFAPIFWLTQNLILSVNLFALLTLILTFLSSYYTLKYFVKSPYAALIGAAIFTFNPQTMVRFPQHIDILNKYFLPLVFLFGYQFLEKPSFKKATLFFLTFSLNALSVTYYLIFTAILVPLAAIPFLWTNFIQNNLEYFKKIARYSLVGLVFLPTLFYFNMPYLEFSQKEGATRSADSTTFFSARIYDWIASTPDNLIYSSLTKSLEPLRAPKDDRGILNYEEHTLFLNIVPLVLFILGWVVFRKQSFNIKFFYILLIASFIYTFGPYFMGNSDQKLFPMPLNLLYQFVPFLQGIRSPVRFEFVMYLPFALIAAFGVVKILNNSKKHALMITAILLALIALENFSTKQYDETSLMLNKVHSTDKKVLNLLTDKNVLHLPVINTQDADQFGKNSGYLNWLTVTHERLVNGNSAYLPADQMKFLDQIGQSLDEEAFKRLSMIGVDYVVIHKSDIKDYSEKFAPLEHFYDFGEVYDADDLLIVDLHKYQLNFTLCDFDKDFTKEIKPVINEEFLVTGYGLSIKNNSNCFLPTLLSDRYQKMTVEIEGEKRNAYFRLPILIEPMEEVVLTELNKELRIE